MSRKLGGLIVWAIIWRLGSFSVGDGFCFLLGARSVCGARLSPRFRFLDLAFRPSLRTSSSFRSRSRTLSTSMEYRQTYLHAHPFSAQTAHRKPGIA
eukprot:scaffold495_cov405-Prasinococcus_capsulatus_cf.AAC.2